MRIVTWIRTSAGPVAFSLVLLLAHDGAAGQHADTSCVLHLKAADFVGPVADLGRLLDLTDSTASTSFAFRRVGRHYRVDACSAPAAVRDLVRQLATPAPRAAQLIPADLLLTGNSGYARDWNDGALWSGRGMNAALTAGIELRWGPLTAAFAPVLTWQPNQPFELQHQPDTTRSIFAHPWYAFMFDAPQRFGARSFARIDPGQSFVRVDVAGFATGFSTENLTWGPARRNALMLSGTAPGFAHVFLETGRAVNAGIAGVEFQLFLGRLQESDYYDDDPANDARALAGILISLQPYVLEGLHIGGGRLHARTWTPGLPLNELLLGPYRGVRENPAGLEGDNQLLMAFFRWTTAPAGIEVYGEWARDDHWGEWLELLRILDYSQSYTLGLQKLVRFGDRALRLAAEITHLADALPILHGPRGFVPFYTNTSVVQGHTHRGQMLGAPIGTGAESQFIGADYFWRGGRTSLSVERARYEDDHYNATRAPYYGAEARDVEFSLRGGHMAALRRMSFDVELGWSRRYNRMFLGLDSIAGAGHYRRENNWSARIGVRLRPPELLR